MIDPMGAFEYADADDEFMQWYKTMDKVRIFSDLSDSKFAEK